MDNGLLNAGMEESKDLVALADGSTGLWKDDQVVYRDEILTGYTDFKGKLDTELKANAEGFVRIGYLLKVARDTNILAESGYKNVAEFAFAEYQLTKDIVSRYIAINDKYAENGYSDKLQTKFEGFGVAKLQEMLTLPDAIIEEIEPTLTKREIIDIKREVAAEEAITPIEMAIEAAAPEVQKEEKELTLTQRVWKDIIKGFWDKYNVKDKNSALNKIITTEYPFVTDESFTKPLELALYELIAPSGTATLWARIPGVGRYMVTIKGLDEPINMVNARDGSKINTSFADAVRDIAEIFEGECTAESWEKVYGLKHPKDTGEDNGKQDIEKAKAEKKGDKGVNDCKEDSGSRSEGTEKEAKAGVVQCSRENNRPSGDAENGYGSVRLDSRPTGNVNEYAGNLGEAERGSEKNAVNDTDSRESDKSVQEEKVDNLKPEVAPVQPKQLGNLDMGDRVVNTETGELGTMVGICAGDYKIAIEGGGITLVSKDSTRWAKAEEKKEAEPEPEAEAPEQEEQKQTFDFEKWHETMLADIEALDTMFERNYKAEMWKKEDLWELMEKANKLISDAGIPLKVKAEDGGLA